MDPSVTSRSWMPSKAVSQRFPGCPQSTTRADLTQSTSRLWDHITWKLKAGERLSGGKPKPEVVYRKAEDALLTLAGEWKERFDQLQRSAPGQDQTPPVMIVVCDNTDIAKHFYGAISGEKLIEAIASEEEDDDDDAPKRKRKKPKPTKSLWNGVDRVPRTVEPEGRRGDASD